MAGNNNYPMHHSTNYGVELEYMDGHKETAWWWGQPHGFWSWYGSMDETAHPNLVAKRPVIKNVESYYGNVENIRERQAKN